MDTFAWYRPEGKSDAKNKRHGWIRVKPEKKGKSERRRTT